MFYTEKNLNMRSQLFVPCNPPAPGCHPSFNFWCFFISNYYILMLCFALKEFWICSQPFVPNNPPAPGCHPSFNFSDFKLQIQEFYVLQHMKSFEHALLCSTTLWRICILQWGAEFRTFFRTNLAHWSWSGPKGQLVLKKAWFPCPEFKTSLQALPTPGCQLVLSPALDF